MDLYHKFLTTLDTLTREGVDYILIGGFAVILYGLPRTTQDIDIIVKPDKINVAKLKHALKAVFEDTSIDEITSEALKEYAVVRYGSQDGYFIDLIAKIGDAADYNSLAYDTITVENKKIKIATPEALFNLKKSTVRPEDKRDALFLSELIKRKLSGNL
jgi:hypothetical protein